MSPNVISSIVFASLLASAMLAMRFRMLLPHPHLSTDTKDTVKLTMGLVATMTALVLGLLVASTKQAYDTEKSEVTQMAAKIIYLDRVLADFGPETAETRKMLRETVDRAIVRMWPHEKSSDARPAPSASWNESLPGAILKLAPQNELQRAAQSQAVALANELRQMRWLLFEQSETSISMPMLVVVICWLGILFFSFGLFAPANGTAIGALMVAAVSVAGAVFLILELDHPFDGLIDISSQPMRNSLAHLGE